MQRKTEFKILYWELVIIGAVAGVAFLYHSSRHEVKYSVAGKADGKDVIISYLERPYYEPGYYLMRGQAHNDLLTRIRIPAASLPWTKTVYLPKYSVAFVVAENEDGTPGRFSVSLKNGKRESINSNANQTDSVGKY